jgi:hypothetical protein
VIRRLSFIVLLLFTALVVLIIGFRLVGGTQPEPEVLTRALSKADGSSCSHWCLFGVMPVTMTGLEAVSTLDRHNITRNMKKTLVGSIGPNNFRVDFFARDVLISVDNQGLWVSMSYDNWYTDSDHFSIPDWILKPVYLGDIIGQYSEDQRLPANAQITGDRLRVTYANNDTRILFIFQMSDPARIKPTDKLIYIGVSNRVNEVPLASRVWDDWYGFTQMERYTPIFTN